jgi:hypothetical protein
MRKRWSRFVAVYRHALDLGVGEDDAIIVAVRETFSKKRRHSDEWRLRKGRDILCWLARWGPRFSPQPPFLPYASRGTEASPPLAQEPDSQSPNEGRLAAASGGTE